MYLLKPLNIFIIYMLIVNPVFARNVYIVKNGDILSTIVLKNTAPPRPLYGINGRLAKVLSLNPSISDMNYITVGQEIILVPFALLTENKLKPVKDKIIEEKVAAANVQDSWSIGLSYGLKYFTLNQSGVLGSPNLGPPHQKWTVFLV